MVGKDREAAFSYGFARGLEYAQYITTVEEPMQPEPETTTTADPAMRWSLRRVQS